MPRDLTERQWQAIARAREHSKGWGRCTDVETYESLIRREFILPRRSSMSWSFELSAKGWDRAARMRGRRELPTSRRAG